MKTAKSGYRLPTLALLGLVSLAGIYILTQREKTQSPNEPPPSLEVVVGTEVPPDQPGQTDDLLVDAPEDLPQELLEATPEIEVASERKAIESPAGTGVLRGQVLTESGTAIVGARVSWTAWTPQYLPFVLASVEIPIEQLELNTLQTETDENGYFFFDAAPTILPGEASYVWASHPDYFAQVVPLPAGQARLNNAQSLVLEPAPTITVHVRDGEGPVAGARIIQQMAYPRGSDAPIEGGKHAPQANLVFFRSFSTGPSGRALAAPLNDTQRLRAEDGTLVSTPWIGNGQRAVYLSLVPTFELSGYVDFPDELKDDWGLPHVRITRQRASLRDEIGTVPVAADGTIAPVLVPILRADRYKFTIEGAGLLPDEQEIPQPRPDEKILIGFEGKIGSTVWFQAINSEGDPILNAEVHGHWLNEDGRRIEKIGRARPDGYIRLVGIPDGSLHSTISVPGYDVVVFGPIPIPEVEKTLHAATLTPGYQLKGRCLRDGKPLSDFEVRYWLPGEVTVRSRLGVIGSLNGEFTIDDLPSQKIALEAISPAFERSDVTIIDLGASPNREVLLKVRPPSSMSGTVVDARTLEPIGGARIEIYSTMWHLELDPLGDPVVVSPDGKFNIKRLAQGNNVVSFSAPGYSVRELKVLGASGGVNLGLIELSSQQSLTARLVLPEGQDPQEYILVASGVGAIPPTQFDANGEIFIEAANEGAYTFEITDPFGIGRSLLSHWQWLRLGEEWHLDFDTTGGHSLLVRISTPEETHALGGYRAYISYQSLAGSQERMAINFGESGEIRVPGGIGPGPLLVQAHPRGSDGSLAATKSLLVDDTTPTEIQLDLALIENPVEFLVVDPDGAPLPGVNIALRASRLSALATGGATTDSTGKAVFLTVPDDVDSLTLIGLTGGVNDNVPFVRPKQPGDVVEVVFDMGASIRLYLHDGGAPQSTVVCRLWSIEHGYPTSTGRTANNSGDVTLGDLGPGAYELQTDGPEHWPVAMEVIATSAGSHYTVEVRRIGDLDLELTRQGGAAANQVVELRHVALGETVSEWIEKGLLHPPAGATSTDGNGLLQLRGIPHGEYIWSCAGGGGSLTVKPGELLEVQGVLP